MNEKKQIRKQIKDKDEKFNNTDYCISRLLDTINNCDEEPRLIIKDNLREYRRGVDEHLKLEIKINVGTLIITTNDNETIQLTISYVEEVKKSHEFENYIPESFKPTGLHDDNTPCRMFVEVMKIYNIYCRY